MVIIISFLDLSLFEIADMSSIIPYIGVVLTGILVSRGSNYIYEIIKLLTNLTNVVAVAGSNSK